MSVRSYTPGEREKEMRHPRKVINRANIQIKAENPNSPTQRRKRNKPNHTPAH